MPVVRNPSPPTPIYHMAPVDVQNYLYSRGWKMQGNENLWMKSTDGFYGEDFQWPEALAYEIFQNFVLLKTGDE